MWNAFEVVLHGLGSTPTETGVADPKWEGPGVEAGFWGFPLRVVRGLGCKNSLENACLGILST